MRVTTQLLLLLLLLLLGSLSIGLPTGTSTSVGGGQPPSPQEQEQLFLTVYGWGDFDTMARTCTAFSCGDFTTCLPQLEVMRARYGVRGMLGGPGVFTRGNWTFASGGLVPGWVQKTDTFIAAARPSCANGTVQSIFFGDELVCSGVPLQNLTSVVDRVRAGLAGTGVKLYTNECGGGLNQGTVAGCYKAECRAEWAWPTVPAALDWLSIDAYNEGNRDGAAEVALVRRRAEKVIFPRMHAGQSLVLVPGVFANSPAGCRRSGLRCPLAQQSAQVVAKLRGYIAWAQTEPRIAGLHSWHLLNRTNPNHAPPWDQELGLVSMPDVVAELAKIKRSVTLYA